MTQNKKTDRPLAAAQSLAPALYVNYFEVGHNPFEFLVDLGQYNPGSSGGEGHVSIHTRIAIAPPYAKMLSELLARAVAKHESEHGQIALIAPQTNPFDIVLSSLGDFEDRARALRARNRKGAPADPDEDPPAGDPAKFSRSRRGR
jgi:hypothetical protein